MKKATDRVWNICDYGTIGDGVTLDTQAINQTISECNQAGGGTVWVPAGVYLTGTIELLSNVTLYLDAGSMIQGSSNVADYPQLDYSSEFRNTALITAIGADNIAITGRGCIDGNGDSFMNLGQADLTQDFVYEYSRQGEDYLITNNQSDDGPLSHKERPGILILILKCSNVQVSNIKIQNSPNWCLHVARTDGALLTGLEIKNSLLVPNADCIDVSRSKNVRISDCNLEGGDDGIAFSPCAEGYGESTNENIIVENCTIVSRSVGIRLGWDSYSFRNFLFQNIVITNSNRGIGIFLREGETIENVVFNNIIIETRLHKGKWWGKAEPIHISAVPLPAYTGEAFTGKMGKVRNVRFSNITATSEQGIVISGNEESLLEDVTFENIHLTINEGPLQESFGGNFDFRPSRDKRLNVFAHDIPGLYASYVKNLNIRNFDLNWQGKLPEYCKNGVEIENFENITIDGFSGRQPQSAESVDGAAVLLRNGSKVTVRNSAAKPGTGCFLRLDQVDKQGLFVHNDVSEAKTMITPDDHYFTVSANLQQIGDTP